MRNGKKKKNSASSSAVNYSGQWLAGQSKYKGTDRYISNFTLPQIILKLSTDGFFICLYVPHDVISIDNKRLLGNVKWYGGPCSNQIYVCVYFFTLLSQHLTVSKVY